MDFSEETFSTILRDMIVEQTNKLASQCDFTKTTNDSNYSPRAILLNEIILTGRDDFGCSLKYVHRIVEEIAGEKLPPNENNTEYENDISDLPILACIVLKVNVNSWNYGINVPYVVSDNKYSVGGIYDIPAYPSGKVDAHVPLSTKVLRPGTEEEIDDFMEAVLEDPTYIHKFLPLFPKIKKQRDKEEAAKSA